jgi:serine-type D-Ala-D-Ala carboxypeptidase/endopeptidase (penicillin-binding protein 4)
MRIQMSSRTPLGLFIFFLWSCMLPAQAEGLPAPVQAALKNHKLDEAGLSIFVQAVDADAPLLAFNADVLRSPASTIKLLTTYAALDLLGPGFRWQTEVWATGPLRNGRLEGDLVLRGGGDPGLSTERFWTMLRELRARGVSHIAGDLVIDDSLFAPSTEQPGDFDRQPFRAYNVLPHALLVGNNAVEFRVMRASDGIRLHMDPALYGFQADNRIGSRPGRCSGFQRGVAFELPDGLTGHRAVLSGTFPAGCTEYSLYRAVLPAPEFANALFRELWQQLGGRVEGGLRVAPLPEDARLLYRHYSVPLADQLRYANKWSNNAVTRHLFLTLGIARDGAPGTPDKARAALMDWLEQRGLAAPGVFIDNGSGLSRETRFTAALLGRLLLDAWAHPQMPELMSSLPISAVDGTLRSRYNDEMAGRLYLKTGRLEGVSSIAGLMHNRAGQRLVVVVIVNHPDAHRGGGVAVQDAVMRWVFNQELSRR